MQQDPGEELAGMEGLPEGAEVATATATSWAGINPRRATVSKFRNPWVIYRQYQPTCQNSKPPTQCGHLANGF